MAERKMGGISHTVVKIASIASNTFLESIRQPVFGVVLAVAFALIIMSPYTTFFTLMESPKVIKDMGLATILLAGLLLAASSAGNVIAEEMDNRTAMAVLSKPVGRREFILGKYFGVAGALLVGGYVLSVVLLMTVAGGAFEADMQVVHRWVVVANAVATLLTVLVAGYINFASGKTFVSTAVVLAVLFFTVELLVFLMWTPPPEMVSKYVRIDPQLALGALLVVCAVLVIGAVAVAASTRLQVVANLALCAGVLLLGLMSEYVFGRFIDSSVIARVAYAAVPNVQAFWVAHAVAKGNAVPYSYFLQAAVYAGLYIAAMLCLAVFLFEKREVS